MHLYSHVSEEGKITPIQSEKPLELAELQKLVGGYIEFVEVELGVDFCVNEEGRINGSKRNARYPWVFGDVVIGRRLAGINGDIFVGVL